MSELRHFMVEFAVPLALAALVLTAALLRIVYVWADRRDAKGLSTPCWWPGVVLLAAAGPLGILLVLAVVTRP
jgi:hypothetical protein